MALAPVLARVAWPFGIASSHLCNLGWRRLSADGDCECPRTTRRARQERATLVNTGASAVTTIIPAPGRAPKARPWPRRPLVLLLPDPTPRAPATRTPPRTGSARDTRLSPA